MSVQTIHFRGRVEVCENQHFFHTLLTFWRDFYYFHGDFWHSKNVDVYSFGGRGSQKVYGLYTHENVDIYGWPPKPFWYVIKSQQQENIEVAPLQTY